MTTREFLDLHGYQCAYCGGAATQRDHVVPSAMQKRFGIKHSDVRFHVPACRRCNENKLTRRYFPRGFDTSILPGSGWQLWTGGQALEVVR